MPAIILFDNSFSMGQSIQLADGSTTSRFAMGILGVQNFLANQAANNRLNPSALLVYSNQCQTICNLTRDYDALLNGLKSIPLSDRTNLIEALSFINKMVTEDCDTDYEYDILIVTDGNSTVQSSFLDKHLVIEENKELSSELWPIPFEFKNRIHIICITTVDDVAFQRSLTFYKTIISRNSSDSPEVKVNTPYKGGQIYVPTVPLLSYQDIEGIFTQISRNYFKPCLARITCGELSSNVSLFPTLECAGDKRDNAWPIEICGFFDFDELATPPSVSKHIVLPMKESKEQLKRMLTFINVRNDLTDEDLDEIFDDENKQPSFAVLLHGSAKAANMVALCQIGVDCNQYGVLYSRTDNKKRSNLMLYTFEPGAKSILGISNFNALGFGSKDNQQPPTRSSTAKKPSNIMVWLDQESIQNDIQKILRYARKLPEKNELLLSEVRKVKRAAFAYDFQELIETLIQMLEREAFLLPTNSHPDTAIYIENIIRELRLSNV